LSCRGTFTPSIMLLTLFSLFVSAASYNHHDHLKHEQQLTFKEFCSLKNRKCSDESVRMVTEKTVELKKCRSSSDTCEYFKFRRAASERYDSSVAQSCGGKDAVRHCPFKSDRNDIKLLILQAGGVVMTPEYRDAITLTSNVNSEFAYLKKIDYLLLKANTFGNESWGEPFNRLYALGWLLEASTSRTYDWVLYLDADAFVSNPSFDVLGMIRDHYQQSFIFCMGSESHYIEINNGVFFANLKHPKTRQVIIGCLEYLDTWRHRAISIDVKDKLNWEKFIPMLDDQSLMRQQFEIDSHEPSHVLPYLKVFHGDNKSLFNYVGGPNIQHYLRACGANRFIELRNQSLIALQRMKDAVVILDKVEKSNLDIQGNSTRN
jgi:hypothetical protein